MQPAIPLPCLLPKHSQSLSRLQPHQCHLLAKLRRIHSLSTHHPQNRVGAIKAAHRCVSPVSGSIQNAAASVASSRSHFRHGACATLSHSNAHSVSWAHPHRGVLTVQKVPCAIQIAASSQLMGSQSLPIAQSRMSCAIAMLILTCKEPQHIHRMPIPTRRRPIQHHHILRRHILCHHTQIHNSNSNLTALCGHQQHLRVRSSGCCQRFAGFSRGMNTLSIAQMALRSTARQVHFSLQSK